MLLVKQNSNIAGQNVLRIILLSMKIKGLGGKQRVARHLLIYLFSSFWSDE